MTVSIILPNYNHANYLSSALTAIVLQNLKPYEVIVVDDASTDNSLEILSELEKKYQNIKVLKNKKNLGPIKSVSCGLEASIGKYIAFCSADDCIEKDFLEVMVSCLEKASNLALCTSDFCTFNDEDIKEISIKPLLNEHNQRTVYPADLKTLVKNQLFWIPTNASLYRKEALKEFLPINEDLKWMSDWFINYQIAFHYPISYIPKPLAKFRISKNSYSHNREKNTCAFDKLFYLLESQSKEYQVFFKGSGLLYQQGRSAFKYLLSHPKRWNFLPQVLKNTIRYKLSKSVK